MPPGETEPAHPDYRFTLANERTLLAWLRTGLALVAAGVAMAQFAPGLGVPWGGAAVAVALVLTGLGTALGGYRRWRRNEWAIATGRPLPPSRVPTTVVASLSAVLVVVAVLVGIEVIGA
ncbi:YidH family protein [Geodermatophilus ruber]|uniref:Putative membrane protein n=1 Tax=Geodermatophilus ruber TaxID=504800 RepID=A0A1I4D4N2_9ACTN|nr:DUF202 domain-containing protein [Geodermatophilus ruber]SFK86981.1 putative membrane protein [Geodermatophilus ruber]